MSAAVLFGLGAEGKAATLFVADNEPGAPFVGELDTSSGLSGSVSPRLQRSRPNQRHKPRSQRAGVCRHRQEYLRLHERRRPLGQFRKIVSFGALGDLAFDGTTLFVADNEPGAPFVGELDTIPASPRVPPRLQRSWPNQRHKPRSQRAGVCRHRQEYLRLHERGALLGQFRKIVSFGALGDLALDGTTLFVADNEPGAPFVGELDTNSGLSGFVFPRGFSVPGPINGISPGPNGQVFVATDRNIYDYTSDGALLDSFARLSASVLSAIWLSTARARVRRSPSHPPRSYSSSGCLQ